MVFVLLFGFITLVLWQEALKTALFKEVIKQPDGRKLEVVYGGKDDLWYDEAAESGTRTKLALAIKEMAYRPGKEAIYRGSLKEFDNSPQVHDELREPTALTKTENKSLAFTDLPQYYYDPAYTVWDKTSWTMTHKAELTQCSTPWKAGGTPDRIRTFLGKTKSFPPPLFGNQDTLGWEKSTCFERRGRWAPYGFTEEGMESEVPEINWEGVNWGGLQDSCFKANKQRFELQDHGWGFRGLALGFLSQLDNAHHYIKGDDQHEGQAKRTAVLLQVSYKTKYHPSDVYNIRALINELSFHTGGQYQVYLLAQADEADAPDEVWTDPKLYAKAVAKSVPAEFASITHLYTERLIRSWYPELPIEGTYDGAFNTTFSHLPIQRFAHLNPSFAYLLNLDINTRFTGHWYDFARSLPSFARRLPRKLIYEKSERLYIPSIHGPFDTQFRNYIEGTVDFNNVQWNAPVVPEFLQHGPRAPGELPQDEHHKWGVGEEADYIALSPIFKPRNTSWEGRGDIFGYINGTHLPRRAVWNTQALHSKLLLDTMHHEALQGRFLNSRMAAPTLAMLHNLKAVYAPIPVWMENAWEGDEADKIFNSGPRGVVGSTANSSYGGHGRPVGLFWGESTFDAESRAAEKMWDRFMGRGGWKAVEQNQGRVCLPPMLLFPIRNVTRIELESSIGPREKVVWEHP